MAYFIDNVGIQRRPEGRGFSLQEQ